MPDPTTAPEQWHEYRRLVLASLDSLRGDVTSIRDSTVKSVNEIRGVVDEKTGELSDLIENRYRDNSEDIGKLRERIAIIEAKAAAYGFIAGLVVSIAVGLFRFIPTHATPILKKDDHAYSSSATVPCLPDDLYFGCDGRILKQRPEALARGPRQMRYP